MSSAGVAVANAPVRLEASGPTEVTGTEASAVFTIDALHVKVPPKSAAGDGQEAADAADGPADGKTRFTLRISATVPEPPNLIPGLDALKIKGAVFGVTNEPAQQTA